MPDKIPQLNLTPEIEGASKIYDLKIDNPIDTKNVGLAVDVLNIIALEFRDKILNDNFHEEFAKIHSNIYDSIQNPKTGYLLELVVYVDSNGFLTLPQGRIINPIGIGVEPLDAMATYLNTDRMVSGVPIPKSLKNGSSFLWITKSENRISAKSITNSFYDKFMELANDEAQKRKLMGEWITLNNETNLKELRIAQYWGEIEKQKKVLFADEATRLKVEKLTSEMNALQEKTNELYKQFQKTQEEMVNCQKLSNTLNAISNVAGLIKSGIQLNQTMSSSNKPVVNGDDNHLLSLEDSKTITDSRLTELGMRNTELTTTTKQYLDNMGVLHTELSTIYHEQVEPIPTLDNNPLLVLP